MKIDDIIEYHEERIEKALAFRSSLKEEFENWRSDPCYDLYDSKEFDQDRYNLQMHQEFIWELKRAKDAMAMADGLKLFAKTLRGE